MTLYAIIAGIVAAFLALWKAYATGKSQGKAAEARKHADAYTAHLEDVAAAADARNNASELPDDKYRRD